MFPKDINIKSIISDSTSEEVKNLFDNEMFDIIIDDGLHTITGIYKSIINLFPKLKNSGIYVIEDVPNIELFNVYISALIPKDKFKVDVYNDISGINYIK
jgi:hypothetical protein